jgi:hypothetical protein
VRPNRRCTTTPVTYDPAGRTTNNGATHRLCSDVPVYNGAAAAVVAAAGGIETNDLYAFALPILPTIQLKQNVHYHEAGSEALGGAVAACLQQALAATGNCEENQWTASKL